MTGVPEARASTAAMPKFSAADGRTYQSAASRACHFASPPRNPASGSGYRCPVPWSAPAGRRHNGAPHRRRWPVPSWLRAAAAAAGPGPPAASPAASSGATATERGSGRASKASSSRWRCQQVRAAHPQGQHQARRGQAQGGRFVPLGGGGEVQGSRLLEVAPFDQVQQQAFTAAALGQAPRAQLADAAQDVGNAGPAGLDHGAGGGIGEKGMDVEQVVMLQMPGQPETECRAEGELPQGRHRRTPAGEREHRHPLVPLPASGDQLRVQARAIVVGGEDGGVHVLEAQGRHHVDHGPAGAAPQRADRGDHMQNPHGKGRAARKPSNAAPQFQATRLAA